MRTRPKISMQISIQNSIQSLIQKLATTFQVISIHYLAVLSRALISPNNQVAFYVNEAGELVAGNGHQVVAIPGEVKLWAGVDAPAGWAFCYGQAVNRAENPKCFLALGTTYGVGDGSTTFNLPDLRGRVPAGRDNMGGTLANRLNSGLSGVNGASLGATGGSQVVALAEANIPSLTANIPLANGAIAINPGTTAVQGTDIETSTQLNPTFPNALGTAHQNVPPTIILNYIIRLT